MRPNITKCIAGVSDSEIESVLNPLDIDKSGTIEKREFKSVLRSPIFGVILLLFR
jgi:hypothetical protein